MTRDDLVTYAGELSDDLAAAHRDLAQTRKMALVIKKQAWMNSNDSTVTGRKQAADIAASEYEAMALEQEGETRALTVQLAHIDRQLTHMKGGI
jgi:hypothetical protein